MPMLLQADRAAPQHRSARCAARTDAAAAAGGWRHAGGSSEGRPGAGGQTVQASKRQCGESAGSLAQCRRWHQSDSQLGARGTGVKLCTGLTRSSGHTIHGKAVRWEHTRRSLGLCCCYARCPCWAAVQEQAMHCGRHCSQGWLAVQVYLNLIARTTAADFTPTEPGPLRQHTAQQQNDTATDTSTAPVRQEAQLPAAAAQSTPSTAAATGALAVAAAGGAEPKAAHDPASRQTLDMSADVPVAIEPPTGGEEMVSPQPPHEQQSVQEPQAPGEHQHVSDAAPAVPSPGAAVAEGVDAAVHVMQHPDAPWHAGDMSAAEQCRGGVKRKLDTVV